MCEKAKKHLFAKINMKRSFINVRKIYETREEAENAVYDYAEDTYDEVLDMDGDIIICGLSYSPSIALKRVDEVAYRCYLHDYADSLMCDIEEIEEDEE